MVKHPTFLAEGGFRRPNGSQHFSPFGDMTPGQFCGNKSPREQKYAKRGILKLQRWTLTDSFLGGCKVEAWRTEDNLGILDCKKHLWHTPKVFTFFRPWKNGWVGSGADLSSVAFQFGDLVTFQGRSLEATNGPTGMDPKCRKAIFFGDFNWDIYARHRGLYIYI